LIRVWSLLWPRGLAEHDPDCAAWHLARCRACPDRAVKLREIQMAGQLPMFDVGPVDELGGVAFVRPMRAPSLRQVM
jgi:hypothetical protein